MAAQLKSQATVLADYPALLSLDQTAELLHLSRRRITGLVFLI
jgi:hypothetical protein